MAIDVGIPAVNQGAVGGGTFTVILKTNPANATGTIDHIDIYDDGGSSTHDVASFTETTTDNFTTTGYALGLTTGGSGLSEFDAEGDFTSFEIEEGDFIGLYGDNIDRSGGSLGDLTWYASGDQIPSETPVAYTANFDRTYALYATGVEGGGAVAPTSVFYGPLVGPMGGPI